MLLNELSQTLFDSKTDIWYQLTANESEICEISERTQKTLFYSLYIGLNRKPKEFCAQPLDIYHTSLSHKIVFDIKDNDIFWCTADVGWVTGHSYIVYGPLCNGTTTIMFEGIPTYPNASRFWVIDKFKVTFFTQLQRL